MDDSPSAVAITLFCAVIAVTLGITYWAQKKSRTAAELYAAGGRIKPWQNGWAIAGDLLSASTFLGGAGMFFTAGYDTLIYTFGPLVGFVVMLGFVAGPMRRLGRFTFVDAVAAHLSPVPIRIIGALSALAVTLMYLIGQMLGAGGLIEILFGIPYAVAVVIVGSLMVIYVTFGGMLATTWVQFTKAIVLTAGVSLLALLAVARAHFSLNVLFEQAAAVHKLGPRLFLPGGTGMSAVEAASLTLAFILGIAGMPHILMRFFTVPNPAAARRSLAIGMTVVGVVYYLVFLVIAPAGVAYLTGNPAYSTPAGGIPGGSNMVALHLARFLGGNVLFGLMGAVAFATILAVVAGLTVAAASAVSHDLYATVIARGNPSEAREKLVFRAASIGIGILGIVLGIAFQGQNILFLTGLVFSIGASACFPILVMSMYWSRLTTAGAVAGGAVGLALSVGLIVLGPSVWVQVLGNAAPIVPLSQPTIIFAPAAFFVMIVVSLLTRRATAREPARAAAVPVGSPSIVK
jgi:cation/acetate symporter